MAASKSATHPLSVRNLNLNLSPNPSLNLSLCLLCQRALSPVTLTPVGGGVAAAAGGPRVGATTMAIGTTAAPGGGD